MRFLIGIYLTLGIVYLLIASAVGALAIHEWITSKPERLPNASQEVLLLMLNLALMLAGMFSYVAYGLWKRWRLVRSILIGISCWALVGGTFAVVGVLGTFVGLIDGHDIGIDEPPSTTLAIAGATSAFAGFHLWVLLHRSVRESYRRRIAPTTVSVPANEKP